jgi:hypothetical protein
MGPGQQEVGDIGTRDEKDQAHRSEKNPELGPNVPYHDLFEGNGAKPFAPVGVGIELFQSLSESQGLVLGVVEIGGGREPSHHLVIVAIPTTPVGGHNEGSPEACSVRETEARRGHAHDLKPGSQDLQSPA